MWVWKASVTKFRCMWVVSVPSLCLHVTSGMSGTFLTSAHLSSRGEEQNCKVFFLSQSLNITQHMFCPQAPLNLFQNNFADRGTLLVMPTSSRGEINVISCGLVCCPHSGHYDTLCFSPVIPSCFKSCNGHLAMLKGGWEYTGSVTVTRRGAERWRKWWFMLTINSVEARTEPS